MDSIGNYAKCICAIALAVPSVLSSYYGNAHWLTAVSASIGALLVYIVPNVKPPTK